MFVLEKAVRKDCRPGLGMVPVRSSPCTQSYHETTFCEMKGNRDDGYRTLILNVRSASNTGSKVNLFS